VPERVPDDIAANASCDPGPANVPVGSPAGDTAFLSRDSRTASLVLRTICAYRKPRTSVLNCKFVTYAMSVPGPKLRPTMVTEFGHESTTQDTSSKDSRRAAECFSSSRGFRYRIVVFISLCPIKFFTVTMSVPVSSSRVQYVCRNL
jgi:hypothetical protein